MVNTKLSPGDPIFFLHHAWLDRLWWTWQSQDPANRLNEIGGDNIPASTLPPFLSGQNSSFTPTIDTACLLKLGAGNSTNATNSTEYARSVVQARQTAFGAPKPNPALTNYFNDGGGTVTLKHTLWSVNLLPNATIADIMDVGGPFLCTEYL